MTNVVTNYKRVKRPTIDWADWENDPQISLLPDINKNVLSALIIIMHQNEENFGKSVTIDSEKVKAFNFCNYLTDELIQKSVNELLKKKILVTVRNGNEQYFTVPRFFRRIAV